MKIWNKILCNCPNLKKIIILHITAHSIYCIAYRMNIKNTIRRTKSDKKLIKS